MNAIEQNMHVEVMQELPANASGDQSGVKPGFYRTASGNQRKLNRHRKVGHPYVKVIDPNNFAPIGKSGKIIPASEDMILKMDVFRDEAVCRDCNGFGHSVQTCGECGGTGIWYVDHLGSRDKRSGVDRSSLKQVPCADCICSTYDSPFRRSAGKVPCLPCKGTGQHVGASGITIAQQYESVPTTGVVMAIGSDVTRWERGERLLIDTFTGKEYEYEGRKYRIVKQQYPMAKIIGQDDIRITDAAKALMG